METDPFIWAQVYTLTPNSACELGYRTPAKSKSNDFSNFARRSGSTLGEQGVRARMGRQDAVIDHITRGIKLLAESEGEGKTAQKGDRVVFNMRIFLNRGDEVPLNEIQLQSLPAHMIRVEEGCRFIDRTITLGKRQAIAAVEYSLIGMKEGGYRKVRASSHLAYRDKGIPDLIPANAVLVLELWLRSVNVCERWEP
ncbi:MAG: FKBP-type peptidyl-prolyl cis-trans isomerase [Gammaproteobacteria bacterium]